MCVCAIPPRGLWLGGCLIAVAAILLEQHRPSLLQQQYRQNYSKTILCMMSGSLPPSDNNNKTCEYRLKTSSALVRLNDDDDQADREAVTCSVLCSLMSSTRPPPQYITSSCDNNRMDIGDREYQTSESDHCEYSSTARSSECKRRASAETCTEHLQLPMFLSSKSKREAHFVFARQNPLIPTFCTYLYSETYHMIDRCDDDIATWSEKGDNFVVKNVEKFASVSFCDNDLFSNIFLV